MKRITIPIITTALTLLIGCGGSSDSQPITGLPNHATISVIELDSIFYPVGFERSLQDNINYFLDGVGVSSRTHLPYDHVLVSGENIMPSSYTNISTIALYINVLIEMVEIGDDNAVARLERVLAQLEEAPKWRGLFYWLYQFDDGQLAINQDATASAVDNAITSFTLAGLVGAFENHSNERLHAIAARAESLLTAQQSGWESLYDPTQGLLRAGWSNKSDDFLGYYIDRKANESRLAPIWAVLVSEGRVPTTVFEDMLLITGSVDLNGITINPMLTWDGSYFQAMLPALWLDEALLIPDYQMVTDFSRVHAAYADKYGIPFVSASATIADGYAAYGLESVSESYRKFTNAIETGTTGSPHTLALYYMTNETDALKRLNQLKQDNPQVETSAGWVDAINDKGDISHKVIGLDQGMFVGAFIAESIRSNVHRYLTSRNYQSTLELMYADFVADENLSSTP
ncbi:TPA: hypothetical protein I7243_12535 [Vibrio vulnificus]|nr:hypothetical protein [Vibrio vulnificus]HDY7662364.1 hypothetical protein [Vibrio vulnificus]